MLSKNNENVDMLAFSKKVLNIVKTNEDNSKRLESLYNVYSNFNSGIINNHSEESNKNLLNAIIINSSSTGENKNIVDEYLCLIILNTLFSFSETSLHVNKKYSVYAASKYLNTVLQSRDENFINFYILMFSLNPWNISADEFLDPSLVGLPNFRKEDIERIKENTSFDLKFDLSSISSSATSPTSTSDETLLD